MKTNFTYYGTAPYIPINALADSITDIKKSKIFLGLLAVGFAYGQEGRVGINTDNPSATLEVVGKAQKTTVPDGIIAPKITGTELAAKNNIYTQAQQGAIVYVTEQVTGNRTGKVANVDAPGYYYFNGSAWVKFHGGVPDNIYNNNGTLAGNRTVTMGNRTLEFSGNTTSFVKNGEPISVKSLATQQENIIGFYRNGGTTRSGYIGYYSTGHNNFGIANTVGNGYVRVLNHLGIDNVDLLSSLATGRNNITLPDGTTKTADRPDALNTSDSPLGMLTLGANNILRRTTGLELKANSTVSSTNLGLNDYVHISGNITERSNNTANTGNAVITLPSTLAEGKVMGRIFHIKNTKSVDITTNRNYISTGNIETNVIKPNQGVNLVYIAGQVNKWIDITDKELPQGTTRDQFLRWDGSQWVAGNPINLYNDNGTLTDNRTVTMNGRTLDFTGGKTTFINDQETVSFKGTGHTYLGFYKQNNATRNAYFGYPNDGATHFELNNSLGDIKLTTASNGITELASKLKINNLPIEHNANNALLVTDQNGNVKKANLYQAGSFINIDSSNNTISAQNIYNANGTLTNNRTVTMNTFTLNFTGNVGFSQTHPEAKVDISATEGKGFRLTDGTQSEGKVLTSNNLGYGTWEEPAPSINLFDLKGLTDLEIPEGSPYLHYTGLQMSVQPGKWLFNISIGVAHEGLLYFKRGGTFLRLRLLSQEQATVANLITNTSIIHPKAYGPKFISLGMPFGLTQAMISGFLGINNDTGQKMNLYLYADTVASNEVYQQTSPPKIGRRTKLLFSWNESSLFSVKVR